MTERRRPGVPGRAKPVLGPLIVANAGVLVVFLFGPNAQHPILPLSYAGAAVAIAGAIAIVRTLAIRRRDAEAQIVSSR